MRIIEAVAIAALVCAVVVDDKSFAFRLLNNRRVAFVGLLSYSLYLGQFLTNPIHPWPLSWAWNFPLLCGYAFISYSFVEQPMLRFRRQERKASLPSHQPLAVHRKLTTQLES